MSFQTQLRIYDHLHRNTLSAVLCRSPRVASWAYFITLSNTVRLVLQSLTSMCIVFDLFRWYSRTLAYSCHSCLRVTSSGLTIFMGLDIWVKIWEGFFVGFYETRYVHVLLFSTWFQSRMKCLQKKLKVTSYNPFKCLLRNKWNGMKYNKSIQLSHLMS